MSNKYLVRSTITILLGFVVGWVISVKSVQKAAAEGLLNIVLFVAPALFTTSSPLDGSYSDPKHPNCLRIIKVTGTTADISGTDGTPGCPPDGSGKRWNLQGSIQENEILVDFTPKGGPANLKGIFNKDRIEWPDGNAWTLKATAVNKIPTW